MRLNDYTTLSRLRPLSEARGWSEGTIPLLNGTVTLCCMDQDGEYSWGDVNKQPILEVYRGSVAAKYREKHWSGKRNEIHPCDTCNLFWPGLEGLPLLKRAKFGVQAGLYFLAPPADGQEGAPARARGSPGTTADLKAPGAYQSGASRGFVGAGPWSGGWDFAGWGAASAFSVFSVFRVGCTRLGEGRVAFWAAAWASSGGSSRSGGGGWNSTRAGATAADEGRDACGGFAEGALPSSWRAVSWQWLRRTGRCRRRER